jgi:FMN-dependent oxidoreductase (nitrilotriacetate monooxygenase family)
MTLEHHVSSAQLAEAACFDSVFLAHTFGAFNLAGSNGPVMWDPLLVLAVMAAHTSNIGLIGTMSTTFTQPYDLAQRFRTLDQLSKGRAGWNIVTSSTDVEARNFGLDEIVEHDERYRRAAEYIEVCKALWASWDDDALVADKSTGVFVDVARVHAIDHDGLTYRVKGPLHLPPSPQGSPVLVQAGSSPAGRDFAARYAEAVFTVQQTLADGQAFYADVKERVRGYGRDPDTVKILPGLAPVIGPTEAAARAREKELAEVVSPEKGLAHLKEWLGIDFGEYPLDGPVPRLAEAAAAAANNSRARTIVEYAEREAPTLRQLAGMVAGARGHRVIVGTGEQVADSMEEWLREGAADGFNIMPLVLPSGLAEFVQEVVPILQERGSFRTEYEGSTLRQNLGVV